MLRPSAEELTQTHGSVPSDLAGRDGAQVGLPYTASHSTNSFEKICLQTHFENKILIDGSA